MLKERYTTLLLVLLVSLSFSGCIEPKPPVVKTVHVCNNLDFVELPEELLVETFNIGQVTVYDDNRTDSTSTVYINLTDRGDFAIKAATIIPNDALLPLIDNYFIMKEIIERVINKKELQDKYCDIVE